jgi:hypothetical protein
MDGWSVGPRLKRIGKIMSRFSILRQYNGISQGTTRPYGFSKNRVGLGFAGLTLFLSL